MALPAQEPPPADRVFTDEVEVTESSVVIELPRLGKVSPEEFEPEDFVVEVGGERRRVTGVSALDLKANPRPVLVYVDAVLSKPETVLVGAGALARQSRPLTALGPVEIVVDGGGPGGVELRLRASTQPRAVQAALQAIAGEGLGRDAYFESENRPAGLPTYVDVMRGSADRLLAEASLRCGDPPCFLFWLSDGFPAVDDAGVRAASDLAAGLASHGWIVVAMALHVPTPDPDFGEPRPPSFERWKALMPGVKMAPSAGDVSRLQGLSASSFDFYVEPRYQPLRWAAIDVLRRCAAGRASVGGRVRAAGAAPAAAVRVSGGGWRAGRFAAGLSARRGAAGGGVPVCRSASVQEVARARAGRGAVAVRAVDSPG